jgi:UDP-N-acetylglucosamine 2-epimerase (non-hydrolysing)
MRVMVVAGARPNFVKVAPILPALRAAGIGPILVHAGQHRSDRMSGVFFRELELPKPDYQIRLAAGLSHAAQVGSIGVGMEKAIAKFDPHAVLVVGDVNATLAAALAAAKHSPPVPLAHLEAGLRSGDRAMPEEVNRVAVDHLSNLLLASEEAGVRNLQAEGLGSRTVLVGNVHAEAIERYCARAKDSWVSTGFPRQYALLTVHRPENVDGEGERLEQILDAADEIGRDYPVIFPLHPRAARRAQRLARKFPRVRVVPPMGFWEFTRAERFARLILTDSGGVQDEATLFCVPCFVLRDTTERPATLSINGGSSLITGADRKRILAAYAMWRAGEWKPGGKIPLFWDAEVSLRVASEIVARLKEWTL